jgi:tetratricopeptide (TPR) repeat protein
MGKCCHHSKDLKKAIEYYNEAITLDQINTKYIAMMGLGIASLENKDTEIAEQSFKNGAIICNELLRKTPNLWEPLQQLALSHLARGEVSLALENYEKALDVCSAPGVVDFGLRDIGLLERCSLTDLQTVRNLLKSRRKGV